MVTPNDLGRFVIWSSEQSALPDDIIRVHIVTAGIYAGVYYPDRMNACPP